ncbi:hypothetical protein [Streptomyces sp. NPDC127033]|uniref:hypothetical protein n=1 Tax=Streptomyces sp. NPDC127033 TaxID=3347110 RepID=UPI0036607D6A
MRIGELSERTDTAVVLPHGHTIDHWLTPPNPSSLSAWRRSAGDSRTSRLSWSPSTQRTARSFAGLATDRDETGTRSGTTHGKVPHLPPRGYERATEGVHTETPEPRFGSRAGPHMTYAPVDGTEVLTGLPHDTPEMSTSPAWPSR